MPNCFLLKVGKSQSFVALFFEKGLLAWEDASPNKMALYSESGEVRLYLMHESGK